MLKQLCSVFAVMGTALLCLSACFVPDSMRPAASSGAPGSPAPTSSTAPSSETEDDALPVISQTILPPDVVTDPSADPLTGLARAGSPDEWPRPLAVMVDNIQTALPQRGLQQAGLVFEAVTEGGVTRLMAVFSDYAAMPQTGPVCSARGEHVRLLLGMEAIYLCAGASPDAARLMETYLPETLALDGQNRSGALWLDTARSQTVDAAHCWFTDGELFSAAAAQYDMDTTLDHAPRAVFQFVPYTQQNRFLAGGDAREIYLRFSSYANSAFSYDEATGRYVKSQFGMPHMDENTGDALTFDNLLILFADRTGGDGTEQSEARGGSGCYFCDGRYEFVRWVKPAPDAPLSILTDDEVPALALINPGRTYLAIVEPEMSPYFRVDGTALLSGAE